MLFEFRAVFDDGHVALVADETLVGARDRARSSHLASPLARMIDGWGSIRWDALHRPYSYPQGWTTRLAGPTHAAVSPDRSWCGVRLAEITDRLRGLKFNPDDPDVCRKCAREVRR